MLRALQLAPVSISAKYCDDIGIIEETIKNICGFYVAHVGIVLDFRLGIGLPCVAKIASLFALQGTQAPARCSYILYKAQV